MVLPDKETSPQPFVKMGSQELDHIFQARQNLDDVTELAHYADLYKNLGWSPVALDAYSPTPLNIDFQQPQAIWLNLLMDLALKKTGVSLGIRLEPDSRLLVMLVKPSFAQKFLDDLGDWRSACSARAGSSWEAHFLILPQTWSFSPEHAGAAGAPLSVIGPGGIAPVPPATELSSRDPWRWEQPPWEQPPWEPSPGLLLLLQETGYIYRRSAAAAEGWPAWEELYPAVCRSQALLQAVFTPVASREQYYRAIIYEALRAGFRDPRTLLGLIWHAPHGETWQSPEARERLSHWAREIQQLLTTQLLNGDNFPYAAAAPASEKALQSSAVDTHWNELRYLAQLAAELEHQVEELERQQLSSEVAPGRASPPLQAVPGSSPSRSAEEQQGEIEELRATLEEVLSKYQELLNSK